MLTIKDQKTLLGVGLAFLLLMTVSFSYAYFSTSVSGNDEAKGITVTAGTLALTYTDSPEIVASNIRPGWSTTKVVTIKNTGTLDTNYNLVWQKLNNEISKNEMVISATCERLNSNGVVEGTCDSIAESIINDKTIQKNISIESGITHKYTFTILFKETNADQNYNQGKKFSGVLGIEEYKAVSRSFATDSWSTIIANVKAGNGSEYTVGDTKEIDLGTTYGTHTLRVANTSTPSECSTTGFSQTACGFVLEFADIITTHNMNPAGTYKGTQYDGGWNVDGWPATSMRTFVNNDIYNAIPSELKSAIIDTTVVSGHGSTSGETNFTSTDKLYLLSTAEVWAQGSSRTISNDTARDVTRQLDYYKNLGTSTSNYSGAIKKEETIAYYWWLRSAYSDSNDSFYPVSGSGGWIGFSAFSTHGVAPAFRLG